MEITAAQGGHGAAVQALLPVNPSGAQPLLLSADWEGALKVWDMHSGACVQTVPGAHGHVVMGMLPWEVRRPPNASEQLKEAGMGLCCLTMEVQPVRYAEVITCGESIAFTHMILQAQDRTTTLQRPCPSVCLS